ncbi:hypothetical protein OX90_05915 [Pseudomonas coronafaciens pv. porri]|uniref:Uncharacterized protein n=1 Tax=Pseudomonas coronafaciens pv. porri TaxID=83964 RepID=A0ABR5JSK9_9PSED|nr:FlxA-like family protein [Pseudomonas coronafaciens]KOP60498.1 hypothetical protein OX90_05915 [Pseudomonas coronafaciens pv. porri]
MTIINTSTLNSYSSSLTIAVKTTDAEAAKATAASTTETEKTGDQAATEGGKAGAAAGGGSVGGSSQSSLDSTIEKLKQQIKEAQKQLAQQQAQLAAAQSGKGTPEEKAMKAIAIQAQISATSANLQTLQGSLLQLQTEGGVKTTA